MGLDMYLEKEIYIGAEYEHRNITGKIEIFYGGKPIEVDFRKVKTITESVGYWRKANAIHAWFVKNVQGGVDECQRSYVPAEMLLELKKACESVLSDNSLAEKLLPPCDGFFFGGTKLDEGYFQDLRDTIEILNGIEVDADIYYQASW